MQVRVLILTIWVSSDHATLRPISYLCFIVKLIVVKLITIMIITVIFITNYYFNDYQHHFRENHNLHREITQLFYCVISIVVIGDITCVFYCDISIVVLCDYLCIPVAFTD